MEPEKSSPLFAPAMLPDPAPLLFSEEEIEGLEMTLAKRGEWTGERLRKQAPRLVEAVARLTALEVSQEEIAFTLQMSVNSVHRIQLTLATAIEGYKERLARGWREVTMLTIGALREKLSDPEERKKMKLAELGIVAGIGTEKEQLLSGGPTQRIEHTSGEAPIEDFNNYIASLPSVEATVVPASALPATMDCQAEKSAQIGAGAPPGAAGEDVGAGEPPPTLAADRKSAAFPPDDRVKLLRDTASDTDEGGAQ